jgi:hypothetical protein
MYPRWSNVWTKYSEPRYFYNEEIWPHHEKWSKLLTKLVNHENEVKISQDILVPGFPVPNMIKVWTKYSENRLHNNSETDLITETWCRLNKVSRSRKNACTLSLELYDCKKI